MDGKKKLVILSADAGYGHPEAAYQVAELAYEALQQEKTRRRPLFNHLPNKNLVSGMKQSRKGFKQANIEQKPGFLLWQHEEFQAYLRGLESNLKNQINIYRKKFKKNDIKNNYKE